MAEQDLQQQQRQQSPSLDDCLHLLRGERDEQRLAGLLLVTKFCKGDDLVALRAVYDAVGVCFLDRLLRTGMGKAGAGAGGDDNRDVYLQLSVTVLAAFCRVPEIASSEEMVSKIPLILELMSESRVPVLEECYEFLYLVITSCEHGSMAFYDFGGLKVLASQMPNLPDGSHMMELAIKIVQSVLSKLSSDFKVDSYTSEFLIVVTAITRQFAVLHNQLKFDALHILCEIFLSKYLESIRNALLVMEGNNCSIYMRVGVMTILQNRVAPADKFHALILAEAMVSILGERWLVSQETLPDLQDRMPADRCLLLVLESSRVEIAVLLNELAYLKYEASKNTSMTSENIIVKQRNVAIVFSLVENVIKLISSMGGNEAELVGESSIIKVINGLNETIDVVLEYLKDAKEHGQKKGNDLLASVRVVGSYLAETPDACKEKVRELLGYLLTIEGEDEQSPFYSVCFLLPMLCQMSMKTGGCKALVSSGGYRMVCECLIKLIKSGEEYAFGDNSSIFLACDTVMNLLLKKEKLQFQMDESATVDLLKALGYWAEHSHDLSVIAMASSICALLLDYTSEAALLNHRSFDTGSLTSLSGLVARSLALGKQGMSDAVEAEMDLLEIVKSGYLRWSDRFPSIRKAVEGT